MKEHNLIMSVMRKLSLGQSINQSINTILIPVYPRKWGWLDLPHSNSNLSNSHSPSCSIQGILLLQTNTRVLLLHLHLPCLLWSSSFPLALHFKLQRFSQNMPIIPPQHMPVTMTLLIALGECLTEYKNYTNIYNI